MNEQQQKVLREKFPFYFGNSSWILKRNKKATDIKLCDINVLKKSLDKDPT